jgi:hypothetical protein
VAFVLAHNNQGEDKFDWVYYVDKEESVDVGGGLPIPLSFINTHSLNSVVTQAIGAGEACHTAKCQ